MKKYNMAQTKKERCPACVTLTIAFDESNHKKLVRAQGHVYKEEGKRRNLDQIINRILANIENIEELL
jgi:hypothetical protein